MSKELGFLEHDRKDVTYRSVAERLKDFKWVDVPLTEDEICVQAARCMDCGIPFCHAAASGCSLCNVIPEFNEHVYYGRWKDALDILVHTNCFPEFTGRVCPAPCEGACVLGLIRPPVNICKIELAIIEQGFQRGYVKAEPPHVRGSTHVAVIGSGPAGLAAACVLNHAGFHVTVYEKNARPGGLLRYGIPDFKLEKWVLDQRLNLMTQEGIVFECAVNVGSDISYHFLHDRFQAIVLATGAGIPRDLGVPGRDLGGIHFAMDFLAQQNRLNSGESVKGEARLSASGKNVVVIGGGDTGSDCIGTCLRQGALRVVQLEILAEAPPTRSASTPWPQWPLMRRDSTSHKEGAIRRWCVNTTAFTGEHGWVKQVQCAEVEWVAGDRGEQRRPRVVPGSDFTIDAGLVLLAMGFVGPGQTAIVEELGVAKDRRGFIQRDERHMTNVKGVFVAGDMQRGPSLVVHAISDGMQTARNVMAYLNRSQ